MTFEEKLDISDFKKSVENFDKSLSKMLAIETNFLSENHTEDEELCFDYRFARSGMIKVFEMIVESVWKIMQRWIKINSDNKIHEKPKRELFRTACQCGLINDPVIWWGFYEARNKTAHVYHEEIAEEVYALSKQFQEQLRDFAKNLEERI